MQVDVSFSNAKVYDIHKIDVVKGQKFSLITDFTGISRWFSENDPVLSLSVIGNFADVEATAIGKASLFIAQGNITDGSFSVLKEMLITVVDNVNPATDLGLKADAAIPK